MFWTALMHYAKQGGVGAALIAAGALGQSVIDKAEKLPWLHQRAGQAQVYESKVIPKLTADEHCERKRADKAVDLASQAIVAAEGAKHAAPEWEDLPLDCPHQKN